MRIKSVLNASSERRGQEANININITTLTPSRCCKLSENVYTVLACLSFTLFLFGVATIKYIRYLSSSTISNAVNRSFANHASSRSKKYSLTYRAARKHQRLLRRHQLGKTLSFQLLLFYSFKLNCVAFTSITKIIMTGFYYRIKFQVARSLWRRVDFVDWYIIDLQLDVQLVYSSSNPMLPTQPRWIKLSLLVLKGWF